MWHQGAQNIQEVNFHAQVMEERLRVVARSTAEFMRFGTREAALYSLAVMDLQDINELILALITAAISIKLREQRARLSGFDTAVLCRNLCLTIRAIGYAFITLSIMLMPQFVTLHPMVPMFRSIGECPQSWCYQHTRFRKRELPALLQLSQLPPFCRLCNNSKLSGETVLLVSLFPLGIFTRKKRLLLFLDSRISLLFPEPRSFLFCISIVHLGTCFSKRWTTLMHSYAGLLKCAGSSSKFVVAPKILVLQMCACSQMERFVQRVAQGRGLKISLKDCPPSAPLLRPQKKTWL